MSTTHTVLIVFIRVMLSRVLSKYSLTLLMGNPFFSSHPLPGYYYNPTGLMACEPFYSKPSYRILATCSFYFPTTMVLMYCYGSSFHASRFRLFVPSTSAVVVGGTTTTSMATSSIGSQTNGSSGTNNGHHHNHSSANKNNNNNANVNGNQVNAQNNNLKVSASNDLKWTLVNCFLFLGLHN